MLKLNAAYSKKVPADGEYTSQSYHCSIEAELPDGLTPEQLNERVHQVFEFVRASVETELQGNAQPQNAQPLQAPQTIQPPQAQQNYQTVVSQPANAATQPKANGQRNSNGSHYASAKQVNYLMSLASRAGWDLNEIMRQNRVSSLSQLPAKTCSQLIDQLSGVAA